MQLVLAVSAAGVATVLHNAPASATGYTATTSGATLHGEAKAQILQQITSATAGTLDFGKVVPTSVLGTVSIAPDGTITNAGGAKYVAGSGAHVANLTFTGEPSQNISIDAPESVTIINGANSMTVEFNYPELPTVIGANGTAGLEYGGILNVGANQAAGVYSGTYDIYVTYVA